jgi:hypothetical protein
MKTIHTWWYIISITASLAYGVEYHGVFSTHHSSRLDLKGNPKPSSGDFLIAEERAQIRLSGGNGAAGLLGKIDFIHDDITGLPELEIREGYLNLSSGVFDFRAGRQVITWGVGDMLFINDLFPKDYASFFAGRNIEYLKGPISGIKCSLYSSIVSVDIVSSPFFEPNRFPDPISFQLDDPFAGITSRSEMIPKHEWDNGEVAMRISRPISSWDFALYGYHGYFRNPSIELDSRSAPTRLSYIYPSLNALGASAQGSGLGGILSFESGYYDSEDDRDGTNPVIPNPEIRYLVGYQFSPWADFNSGVQYYGEYMLEHENYRKNLPSAFPEKDELRQVLSMRVTQFLKYQTFKLSFLAFFSPTDEDFYLVPEISYKVSDELVATIGGNLFEGSRNTTDFAQMDASDNAYLGLRYEF